MKLSTPANKRQTKRNISFHLAILLALLAIVVLPGCNSGTGTPIQQVVFHTDTPKAITPDKAQPIVPVPILCYHQIRDWKNTDSKNQRVYIMPVANFNAQMKLLNDSGYHTILPDDLIAYLAGRVSLPEKPIMITFDDADGSQYDNALPELSKYGFKGVYFIMTVVLGHKEYLQREQVKVLSDAGNTIGSHTWNHQSVTMYNDEDWVTQIEQPTAELVKITGKPIKYFAYPNGLWNTNAIEHLKKHGFTAAFRLGGRNDKDDPLFTIKRIIVDGQWDEEEFSRAVKNSFK